MIEVREIFVRLLDEGVDVWRPARAEYLGGKTYKIIDEGYDREIETWEFEPGDTVICEWIDSSDGRILAATSRDDN